MRKRKLAKVFLPGEYIEDEITDWGWTVVELEEFLGYSIEDIISGERALTPEIAKDLGDTFGNDAQFWLDLGKSE